MTRMRFWAREQHHCELIQHTRNSKLCAAWRTCWRYKSVTLVNTSRLSIAGMRWKSKRSTFAASSSSTLAYTYEASGLEQRCGNTRLTLHTYRLSPIYFRSSCESAACSAAGQAPTLTPQRSEEAARRHHCRRLLFPQCLAPRPWASTPAMTPRSGAPAPATPTVCCAPTASSPAA